VQTLIIIILAILLGSAVFSGIEAALFSISLSRAKIFLEKKKKGAGSLVIIKEKMSRPITVIVIFNNLFNIVGSIMVGAVAAQNFGSAWIGIISAMLTFLIIIFGEIIPKSIGENYAGPISLTVSAPLLLLTKFFYPAIWFIEKITKSFTVRKKIISEEEIRILSHLGHLEGAIEKDEKEMIQKVFKLNDLAARDIMTPRTAVVALDGDNSIGSIEKKIYSLTNSRLPIYRGSKDKITGVCHQRELLIALARAEKDKKVSEFRREVMVVPEYMKADDLLSFFQKQRCHLAIVVDEFGTTLGIVTLEDVLEQLVGEIVDETDEHVDMRVKARKARKEILSRMIE